MSAVISGTNGLLQSYDYQVLTTGFSYTFAAGTQVLVINPAGTLATGTITMPAAPADGMTITFSSSQQITALTMAGNGASLVGAVTFLPAKTGVTYVYRATGTTWFPTATVPGTGSQLVQGTSVATTSGTSVTFSSIPSWVKRITLSFAGVSVSGSSVPLVQIGDSSIKTTGYLGSSSNQSGTTTNLSSGFLVVDPNIGTAGRLWQGILTIALLDSATNKYVGTSKSGTSNSADGSSMGGYNTLTAVLSQLKLTTVNGTDTFTAGAVNILFE